MNEFKVIDMIDDLLQSVENIVDDLPYLNEQEVRESMKWLRRRLQDIEQACEGKKEEQP